MSKGDDSIYIYLFIYRMRNERYMYARACRNSAHSGTGAVQDLVEAPVQDLVEAPRRLAPKTFHPSFCNVGVYKLHRSSTGSVHHLFAAVLRF
jgi:hypothetical protein